MVKTMGEMDEPGRSGPQTVRWETPRATQAGSPAHRLRGFGTSVIAGRSGFRLDAGITGTVGDPSDFRPSSALASKSFSPSRSVLNWPTAWSRSAVRGSGSARPWPSGPCPSGPYDLVGPPRRGKLLLSWSRAEAAARKSSSSGPASFRRPSSFSAVAVSRNRPTGRGSSPTGRTGSQRAADGVTGAGHGTQDLQAGPNGVRVRRVGQTGPRTRGATSA